MELHDRFHMASAGSDGELIRTEWVQLCDELQALLGDSGLSLTCEFSETPYFDEKTRGQQDAALTEADFMEWWERQDNEVRSHIEAALRNELQQKRVGQAAPRRSRNNAATQDATAKALNKVGLGSEGRIGREVGAQLTEQMMELRGIRGFEEAEQVGDILWDMSKDVTTAGVNRFGSACDWMVTNLPALPGRLWSWLKQPVPISDETSIADWWKVFVLHMLSYCCPLLVFWPLTRKVPPGVVMTDTQSHTLEFLNRSFWLGTSATIPVMWYLGELPTLERSEVWINIALYAFLAVMNSHEEANLSKVREDERTAKKSSAAAADANSTDELPNYSDFIEMAEEIELHTQLSRRVGTTGQRLAELESLQIQDPRFDCFDEYSFSKDHQKEITEARSGKIFTEFSVRFTELIVLLGRQVPWFHNEFDKVANPDPGDPYCAEKQKQYMSCLIKMKQAEIARLRLMGKLETAERLESGFSDLKALHQDMANCEKLLNQLEQLGNRDRNIILRVLPFMSIGLFLLLYVGNFADVISSTVAGIKREASRDDLDLSDVSEAMEEWHCELWCYAARVLSVIFLFTSFMMLFKWLLKQLSNLLRLIFAKLCCCLQCCQNPGSCCVKWRMSCDQNWIERQLTKQLQVLQEQLEQQLGPQSKSPHRDAKTWDTRRAFLFLGMPEDRDTVEWQFGDGSPRELSEDECRCCRARKRAVPIDPTLPLCTACVTRRGAAVQAALKLTGSLDEFNEEMQGTSGENHSHFERLCTAKGRKAATIQRGLSSPRIDSEADVSLHQLVNSWRLMLATYQLWCKEAIDAKYRRLSDRLQRDENKEQWTHSGIPRQELPASIVGQIIHNLSENKAEQKFAAQRAIMILGALSCAAAPWIHDFLLGCYDQRICGVELSVLSSTNSSNTTVWILCESLRPPCRDNAGQEVYRNESVCQLQPQLSGFDQVHECTAAGEQDEDLWWRIIAAFTEFTLTYSIFSLLLRVLRGYHLRALFMEYFSQTVPWPGVRHTEPKYHAYGLLPRFELDKSVNIVAWNKIRCFLQTFEAEEFHQEQQKISWVVLISLVMMITKIVSLAQHQTVKHDLSVSELMDTLMIKVLVMQLQSIVVICNLLWTGVKTTRMQEHGLRHILLLKKGQLTNSGHLLYFSASKRVDMLVPITFTLPQLQDTIETRLGISLAQQRIAVHGISFYGMLGSHGSSVLDRRTFEERRAKLIAKKQTPRNDSTEQGVLKAEDQTELEWYQQYLKKDDAIQPVDSLIKLKDALQKRWSSKKSKAEWPNEERDRLHWLEGILQPYDEASAVALKRQNSGDWYSNDRGIGEDLADISDASFPKLAETKGDRSSKGTHSKSSAARGSEVGGSSSGAAVSLRLKGPSLKALTDAANAGSDSQLSPTSDGHHMSLRSAKHNEGEYSSQSPATSPTSPTSLPLNLVLEEPERKEVDPACSSYMKFQVLIRDGQEIQVTSDDMRSTDMHMLNAWLKNNKATPAELESKTNANVLIIGQDLVNNSLHVSTRESAPTADDSSIDGSEGRSEGRDSAYDTVHSMRSGGGHTREPASSGAGLKFEEWAEIDTMRHLIDSLVAIMEEERLPISHLSTIEDTRPTIRLPFYGPYPLTTALFASVTTVLFGAVSTSVTVLVGQLV